MIPKFIAPEFVVAGLTVFAGLFLVPIAVALIQPPALDGFDADKYWAKLGKGIQSLCIFDY